MPYDIVLNPEQDYSPNDNNNPIFQDWQFNPLSPITINHTIGEALPSAITIDTIIQNYSNADSINNAYQYYVKHRVVNQNPLLPSVIALSGVINDETNPEGYLLTAHNLQVDVVANFQNLQIVPEGNYSINIVFDVYRKGSYGNAQYFESRFYNFQLNVVNGDPFNITPSSITMVYVKGQGTTAPQTLNIVSNGDFTIGIQDYITLTGGNLVDGGLVNDGPIRQYFGSGNQTVSIDANSALENVEARTYISLLKYNNGTLFKTMGIHTMVFDDDEAIIEPESLEFSAIKGFTEAEPLNVSIVSPYNITLTLPSWLTASVTTGDYNLQTIIVPVLTANLSEGIYEGNIIVTANNIDYYLPVTHTVIASVELGMSIDAINFTDDFNTITRFHQSQEYKIRMFLHVQHYKYRSSIGIIKELTYKLGLFNNTTSFFVGRTLNNIMAELEDLRLVELDDIVKRLPSDNFSFIKPYYLPAKASIIVDFIHQNDALLNGTSIHNDIPFITGRKPLKSFDNAAILNFYCEPLRVTPNSVALFNFYKNENHEILIYKNDQFFDRVQHAVGDDRVFAYRHKFYNYTQGDVIEIRLYRNANEEQDDTFFNNPENYMSQKYIVFPEGKRSYHIAWENEHRVVELMEFTGDISFTMGYENKIIQNYKDFKEYLRKLDSKRSQDVIINTGFLLAENVNRLDSLLSAKRAWILNDLGEVVSMVPATKSLANYDSDQELYAYDIEFQINLNNDNKINS